MVLVLLCGVVAVILVTDVIHAPLLRLLAATEA